MVDPSQDQPIRSLHFSTREIDLEVGGGARELVQSKFESTGGFDKNGWEQKTSLMVAWWLPRHHERSCMKSQAMVRMGLSSNDLA